MTVLVPIGTHPGLVSALVGVDLPVASFAEISRATRVFLRRQTTTGAVAASLRNATGGGGDGIDLSFGVGADTAVATGEIEGTDLYLRVTSADAASLNLSGWAEVESSSSVAAALTTLSRVEAWLGAGSSADAALLSDLIAGVSQRMQTYAGREFVVRAVSGEVHDGRGREELVLRGRPVSSVSEVRIDGTAIAASSYQLEEAEGILYRRAGSGGLDADVWPWGSRNVAVDYTSGYSTIPEDLILAATAQVAFLYAQRGTRVRSRSEVLDGGGSQEFLVGPWAPGVRDTLDGYRDVRFG